MVYSSSWFVFFFPFLGGWGGGGDSVFVLCERERKEWILSSVDAWTQNGTMIW